MASLIGLDDNIPADDEQSFDLLPAGDYVGQIIESDVTSTASGGTMLKLTWELINDGYRGRRVWQNINLRNASSKAQEIGQKEYTALKTACGVHNTPSDSAVFHGKPVGLELKIEKSSNPRYPDDKNAVKRLFNAMDFGTRKSTTKAAPAAPAGPAVTPAWAKPAAPAAQEQAQDPAQAAQAPTQAPAPQPPPAAAPAAAAAPPWMKKAA